MNYKGKDITIELSNKFRKYFKVLSKKYKSLPADLEMLLRSLKENPMQGADLGNGLRKVRMAITSKGKGKSGGARIITYTLLIHKSGVLRLLSIYDKADKETISDKELKQLLKDIMEDMQ